ncbi:MAG: CIA30 family protein [Thermostichales cyanobacterium SZTDM-1c_bins_54]
MPDLGRFWQTLWYYDVLPFSPQLRSLLGENRHTPAFLPPLILLGGTAPDLPPSRAIPRRLLGSLVPDLRGLSGVIWGLGSPQDQMLADVWAASKQYWQAYPARLLCDFRDPQSAALWGALDDVVMGGISQSGLQRLGTMAVFAGVVSTEQGGGFASVRTRTVDPPEDLSAYQGISLRLRGDGQRYKILLRQDPGWDSVAYSVSVDTLANQWQTLTIPFADFRPVFRARRLPQAPPLDPRRLCSLQIMLSKFEYDGALNPHFTPGPFRLELDWIGAWGSPSWQVIRPVGLPLSEQVQQTLSQMQGDGEISVQVVDP